MKNKVLSILMAAVMSVSVGVGAGLVTAASTAATPAYAQTAMSVELTGDHYQGNSCETPYSFRMGQDTAHFSAVVSGAEGDVTYTYYVIPRSASWDFRTKEYSSADGKFEWNPERGGIYCIHVEAKDSKGNSATSSLYYMIIEGDLSIREFTTSGIDKDFRVGKEIGFNFWLEHVVGYPTCIYTIIDNSGAQAPKTTVLNNGYEAEYFKWTPETAGTYTITATALDKSYQSATTSTTVTVK